MVRYGRRRGLPRARWRPVHSRRSGVALDRYRRRWPAHSGRSGVALDRYRRRWPAHSGRSTGVPLNRRRGVASRDGWCRRPMMCCHRLMRRRAVLLGGMKLLLALRLSGLRGRCAFFRGGLRLRLRGCRCARWNRLGFGRDLSAVLEHVGRIRPHGGCVARSETGRTRNRGRRLNKFPLRPDDFACSGSAPGAGLCNGRAGDTLGSRDHLRADADRLNRVLERCGDNRWRHAGIGRHRDILIPHDNGLVHDHGLADEDRGFRKREHYDIDLRRHQVLRFHKDPEVRIGVRLRYDVVGRQWTPADMRSSPAPTHPRWSPFVCGHPDPAELAIENPASIVIGDPTPVLVSSSVPSPLVGIEPFARLVGSPILRHAIGIHASPQRRWVVQCP